MLEKMMVEVGVVEGDDAIEDDAVTFSRDIRFYQVPR